MIPFPTAAPAFSAVFDGTDVKTDGKAGKNGPKCGLGGQGEASGPLKEIEAGPLKEIEAGPLKRRLRQDAAQEGVPAAGGKDGVEPQEEEGAGTGMVTVAGMAGVHSLADGTGHYGGA